MKRQNKTQNNYCRAFQQLKGFLFKILWLTLQHVPLSHPRDQLPHQVLTKIYNTWYKKRQTNLIYTEKLYQF
jgi:hypothetical protein